VRDEGTASSRQGMLKSGIEDIRDGIRAGRFTNEAAVCQGVVLRILHELSWPTYNTQIVSPEYSVEGRRVDFALCHPAGKPVVFIEVKQVGQSDGAAERQLFEYAFHKGVPMAILTDGQDWQFFLPAEQGEYGERRVYKLDIVEREIDETVSRLERYLDYQAICSGTAMEAARADYKNVAREREIKATLPEAWRKLVEEEDDLLLELLSDRVEGLCGYKPDPDTVAGFLRESVQLRSATAAATPKAAAAAPVKAQAATRRPSEMGQQVPVSVGFILKGKQYPARNARDVLVRVFAKFADRDPMFLERFATLPKHGRTRRYLARSRDDLYPGRPDLVRDFSHELRAGWWLGINLSRNAIERIVEMACEVAGLTYGVDLRVNLGA
jgi:predicted type IV restriction endonuclease